MPPEAAETADTAESADAFDAEFDAAQAAEAEDEAPPPEDEGEAPTEGAGKEPAAKPGMSLEVATKRLGDTQAALRKERAAARELKDRVAALEQRPAPAQAETKTPDLSQMPDPDVDPIGALQFLKNLMVGDVTAKAEQARRDAETKAQQDQHAAGFRRLQEDVAGYESDFRELHGDYDDAVKHLEDSVRDELAEAGYDGHELAAKLGEQLISITSRALKAGKDPAEIVYNLAKKRGFSASGKSLDNSATKLQKIAQGQAAAKSVGAGGSGSGGESNLTYGSVANLKGAAFDAAFDKLRQRERRA